MTRNPGGRRADVLIVGAGHAGAQAAIALRQKKFEGSIAILGAEAFPPYERPPLSKEYLSGDRAFDRMLLRPESFWAEREVELVLRCVVAAVDPEARVVTTADGETWEYGSLVWATGGAARRLTCEGGDLRGVHTIRTRDDVDQLRRELPQARRAVVVGGGYVGLEGAAALVKAGIPVTIVEMQDRLLARVAGRAISEFYAELHRAKGVSVLLGVGVLKLEGCDGRVSGVHLSNGDILDADVVIAGVGILPAVEPLAVAGAATRDGVDVDRFCRTSLPEVFAIGDCARQVNPFFDGQRIRVESVQNANDQAQAVASFLTGDVRPHAAVPWFWSNQYDVRLQTVGLSAGHDLAVRRGDAADAFSVVYLRQGEVVALDCVNLTRDYVQGRALVTSRARIEPSRLSDPGIPLKDLAPA